ncbi:ubiquinol-cytochrome c reductase complex assembly factor 4 [Brachyhypopomus gauderio]|uniref:ubiquinol-cytochrome c reductase complex assembly factor 4 n=1 Tax=Brachyhypopomus gauderio TaxID=698409 RepID=UPI004042F084
MSSIGRRIFSNVTRCSARSGGFGPVIILPYPVRVLSITSNSKSKRSTGGEEQQSQPLKFSTSKASHRTWKVERSMGSTHQRSWKKVLPLSFICISFLLWCTFRKASEVDQALGNVEHLPLFLTKPETEQGNGDTLASTEAHEDGSK